MKANKRIMIWGSNLFLGISFDDDKKGYVYLASSPLMQLRDKYEFNNFSMTHLSSAKALDYLKKALSYDANYDRAILELGFYDLKLILDGKEDLETFETNLREIIKVLQAYRIETYLATLSPLDASKVITNFSIDVEQKAITVLHKRLNHIIRELAEEFNINLFDGNKTFSKDKKAYVTSDGVSINNAGQNVLKNMILRRNI